MFKRLSSPEKNWMYTHDKIQIHFILSCLRLVNCRQVSRQNIAMNNECGEYWALINVGTLLFQGSTSIWGICSRKLYIFGHILLKLPLSCCHLFEENSILFKNILSLIKTLFWWTVCWVKFFIKFAGDSYHLYILRRGTF